MPEDHELFGQLAIRKGYITEKDLLACLKAQCIYQGLLKKHILIGEIMLLRDLLSPQQYLDLLELRPRPEYKRDLAVHTTEIFLGVQLFGEIAIKRQFIAEKQLLECLDIQKMEDLRGAPHRLIGEIMVDRGYLTPEQRETIVKAMKEDFVQRGRIGG
jgi:hypothetical protein